MRINKLSSPTTFNSGNPDKYVVDVDRDLSNLFLAISGRIRFGAGTDNTDGENINGEFQQFTSDASANTEFSVSHSLGSVPVGYIVLGQDKAGSLYQLSNTGTAWTSSTIYLKCSVSSVTFLIFLLR